MIIRKNYGEHSKNATSMKLPVSTELRNRCPESCSAVTPCWQGCNSLTHHFAPNGVLVLFHAGCTHFIVGRDMAGSKSSLTGEDFYGMYDAQEFAIKHAPELGMQAVPSLDVVYTEEAGYVTAAEAKEQGLHVKKLSGTKFRQMLRGGEDIPEWFAFKSVVEVLREHAQHGNKQ